MISFFLVCDLQLEVIRGGTFVVQQSVVKRKGKSY
jgi:hypothetical protein